MVSQAIVKEWFDYRDGKLFWLKSPKYDIPVGSEAEGKYKFLGYFKDKKEAIMVRQSAERRFLQ